MTSPTDEDDGGPTVAGRIQDILGERDMPLFPLAAEHAGVCYTDFLTGAHGYVFAADPKTGRNYVYTPERNRQCSIGFHGECSDPEGEKCGCPCHQLVALFEEALSAERAATIEAAAKICEDRANDIKERSRKGESMNAPDVDHKIASDLRFQAAQIRRLRSNHGE